MMNSKYNLKNTQVPGKIFRLNVNVNAKAIQCDLCKYLVHIECNHLNYTDHKYFQGSHNPWFCATCFSAIFLFAYFNNNCHLFDCLLYQPSPMADLAKSVKNK